VKCERQFGFETFQISVPSLPPGVVINDPKNLEYVFKNEGIFAKGDFFKRRSRDLFGKWERDTAWCAPGTDPTQGMALSMPTATSGRCSAKLASISLAMPT
jgi:hypothetical protein